jgi:hypothetical protein
MRTEKYNFNMCMSLFLCRVAEFYYANFKFNHQLWGKIIFVFMVNFSILMVNVDSTKSRSYT